MNTDLDTIFKIVYPLCSCSLEIESKTHFFLHCHYFYNKYCQTLLESVKLVVNDVLLLDDDVVRAYSRKGRHGCDFKQKGHIF